MNPIKITIGVPVYNVEKYIERCIRSLFLQTYENIEYVFVNDCTPDNSIKIINDVLKDFPNRQNQVKIISHTFNRGLGAARNTAIENATGDFITWVDSDDWIDSMMIEKMVAKQSEENSDIVTVDTLLDWGDSQSIYKQPRGNLSPQDWLMIFVKREKKTMIWGRLIRLSLYRNNNIRVLEGCNMSEDHQVVPRLAYYAKKMSLLEETLYTYNKSNENAYTAKFSEERANQILEGHKILYDFFSDKDQKYTDALLVGLAKQLADIALQCCRCGNYNYYNDLIKNRMKQIPHTCYSEIPWSLKLVYYLKKASWISCYSKLGHIIRHIK